MRVLLIFMMVLFLGLSGGAAWFFFGGVEDDPARKKRDAYQARIEAILPKAEQGDTRAQLKLARLYRDANNEFKDLNLAASWLSKATRSRNPVAKYELGRLYEQGHGVPQDYMKAFSLYQIAAGLGNFSEAQFSLGNLYFKGWGVLQNYDKAIEWFQKSASGGHPTAQYLIGVMYSDGWGVREDALEAYKWLSLAGKNRKQVMAHDPAYDPAREFKNLKNKMSLPQRAEAKKRLRNWMQK